MDFPGFDKKDVSCCFPNNAVSGRTVDGVYKKKLADGREVLEMYFSDGSVVSIMATGNTLEVAGEFLNDKKVLRAGYSESFFKVTG